MSFFSAVKLPRSGTSKTPSKSPDMSLRNSRNSSKVGIENSDLVSSSENCSYLFSIFGSKPTTEDRDALLDQFVQISRVIRDKYPDAKNDRLVKVMMQSEKLERSTLETFLVDSEYNVKKAEETFDACIKYRISVDYTKPMYEKAYLELKPKIPMHVLPGTSKSGEFALRVEAKGFIIKNISKEELYQFAFSLLDQLFYTESAKEDATTAAFIVDVEDWSLMKNFSLTYAKYVLEILMLYYPRRLGKIFILNYPSAAKTAYNMCYPFMSEYIANLFVFVESKKTLETLAEYFPLETIPSYLRQSST